MKIPFIKLIQSLYYYYFFDVNKNQLLRIPEAAYRNLEQWLQSGVEPIGDSTINRLIKMGYLSSNKAEKIEHPLTGKLKELMETQMTMLILQLTQGCNLRCSYCIYSDHYSPSQRSHSSKRMSYDTAVKAVDYFMKHSVDNPRAIIAFYGGEPLLEFPLLCSIVEYIKNHYPDREVIYNFTTNGTLLTREIMEYCDQNHIYFMISLDGPEKIHNVSRRYAVSGKGSYADVIKNIKYMKENYPELHRRLNISMVVDEKNDYDEIAKIFDDPVMDGISNFYIAGIDDKYSAEKTLHFYSYYEKEQYNRFLGLLEYTLDGSYSGKNAMVKEDVRQIDMVKDDLTPADGIPPVFAPGGPCTPGQTKLFVSTEGKFFPCERVSELSACNCIGNLEDGIDLAAVSKILNIGQLSEDKCRNCWAFSHCKLCLVYADDNGRLSGDFKTASCETVQKEMEERFRTYIAVKECREIWRKR